MERLDKVPPQALEAEMAVLGSMMIEREAIDSALEWVEEKHFYQDSHRKIFRAIFSLNNKQQAADLITVTEELRRDGALAEVGGQGYLTDLINRVATAAHVKHYAQLVREKFVLRELINVSTGIISQCHAGEKDMQGIVDEAERRIFGVAQGSASHGFEGSATLAHEVIDQIGKLHQNKNLVTGVSTGFKELDRLTSGFQKSDLIIIAARPSQGKTAFAMNIAAQVATHKTTPRAVGVFSLEMSKHSIFQRMVCAEARADLHQVRSGFFRKELWTNLTNAAARLGEADLFIDDSGSLSIVDIRTRARRLSSDLARRNKELGLIVIDYLQLVAGSNASRRDGRQQEVSEISRSLKALARDLKVPVVALSQLSRRVEEKGREGRPMLSDLRESGAIEQDADLVMFIYREASYKSPLEVSVEDQRKAEIIIAKQRNGPTDTVPLQFFREWTRFENPAPEGSDAPQDIQRSVL